VIAAETDAAARRLFTTPQQRFLRLIRNQPVELLPPVDSMTLMAGVGGTSGGKQTGSGDCGIECNREGGVWRNWSVTPGADEVIVVTDAYDHADRLHSYQRVADIASKVEVKPAVGVGAEGWPNGLQAVGGNGCVHSNSVTRVIPNHAQGRLRGIGTE